MGGIRDIERKRKTKKRFFTESWGKSSLGARLRTRKVTGRDASLPAPLLSAFKMLVARGTVGALPQTPQGTLSLDPARGRRKGTKSPLDPFSRLGWSRFHAPSACSFLVLRLSPCLPPQLSVKNLKNAVPKLVRQTAPAAEREHASVRTYPYQASAVIHPALHSAAQAQRHCPAHRC